MLHCATLSELFCFMHQLSRLLLSVLKEILIRLFVAAVGLSLVVASLAKQWWVSPGYSPGSVQLPDGIALATTACELVIGCALLTGVSPRAGWGGGVLLFGGFIGFNAMLLINGNASCGCFGDMGVRASTTFVVDVIVFCGLILWRQRIAPDASDHFRRCVYCGSLVCCVALAPLLAAPIVAGTAHGGASSESSLFDPADYIGDEFPLAKYVDSGIHLDRGNWTVVLFRHNCSHCIEALPHYVRRESEESNSGQPSRLLLLEVPPFGVVDVPTGDAVRSRLMCPRELFVRTPTEFTLRDGVIINSSQISAARAN